jgi:hypothetical protein
VVLDQTGGEEHLTEGVEDGEEEKEDEAREREKAYGSRFIIQDYLCC